MVEKMTKFSFILLDEETEGFLQHLQELGVVDITRSRKPVDDRSASMLEKASAEKRALTTLKKVNYKDDPDQAEILEASKAAECDRDLSVMTAQATARIAELQTVLQNVTKTARARMPWGEFDRKAIARLEESGLRVRFYTVPKKSFDESWKEICPLQVISEDSNNVWFVTVTESAAGYSFPAKESSAPEGSYEDAMADAENIRKDIIRQKGELLKLTEHIPDIQAEYNRQLTELDLYLAGSSGEAAAENRLNVFIGFAPSNMEKELREEFDRMGVFYLSEEATEEDNPPIKLKNNRFASMFEVLTGMYGMPEYKEFDPTPVLAPFFMLFFALCLGDAGYGLVLIALGAVIRKKVAGLARLAPLVMTLGAGTFFIGIFMHTFFGFDLLTMDFIPEWMKKCMLDGEVGGFPAAMVLAIGIGVFNICVAMVMKTACYTHRFGFRNTLSTWGWTLLIVGGIILAGITFLGVLRSDIAKWIFIALAIISGLGIYIFNDMKRNPFVNIGAGLWDTYNTATGLLGDTLSFIRLYALGLAGGMLGSTFNMLGEMLMNSCPVPGLNWLLFAIIFVIGHALNIALSCLGAFVHPLRLTFVEFFKNSGYEGSGKAYNPLSIKKEV